jgi:hypothetical protein
MGVPARVPTRRQNTRICSHQQPTAKQHPATQNGGSGAPTKPKVMSRNVTASPSAGSAAVCRSAVLTAGHGLGPGRLGAPAQQVMRRAMSSAGSQLAPGPGGQGPSGSVFELIARQPACLEVLT